MPTRHKKIIVFGVTGEIGGRIAKFAVEAGYEAIRGEIYNIAGKYAVTLERYLEIAKEYLNSNSTVIKQSREAMLKMPYIGEKNFVFLMTHNCIDITKARNTFNFNPVPVEESLVEALKWCEETKLLS